MAEKKLKWCVIGCGQIAWESHIPPLLKNKNVSLTAVCDVKLDAAKQCAARFSIPAYYTDAEEMLKAEKPDAVNVCVPPESHAAAAIQAMEAGSNVLVEKTMAVNAAECDRMIAAAGKNKVKLGVMHNRLYEPVIIRACEMIRKGTIGAVAGMNAEYSRQKEDYRISDGQHWTHRMPGGVFSEELPHIIYLAREFLGSAEPVAVEALKTPNSHEWMAADEFAIIFKGKNGLGTVTASCNRPKPIIIINVFGTRAHLHIDIYNSVLIKHNGGADRAARALDNISQSLQRLGSIASFTVKVLTGRRASGHAMLINRFVASLINNSPLPVSSNDGREVTAAFEKITGEISRKGNRSNG